MIMALIAALLMRLRCFLLRRGEAGRNGALRAEGKMGATVERAVLYVVGNGLCWGWCGWRWVSRSSSLCTVSRVLRLLSSSVKWPFPVVSFESFSVLWLDNSAPAVSPLLADLLSSITFLSFWLVVSASVCLWYVTSVFFWLVTESFWLVVTGGVEFCFNLGGSVGLQGRVALSDWGALSRCCVLSSWSSAPPWLYCCG